MRSATNGESEETSKQQRIVKGVKRWKRFFKTLIRFEPRKAQGLGGQASVEMNGVAVSNWIVPPTGERAASWGHSRSAAGKTARLAPRQLRGREGLLLLQGREGSGQPEWATC